MEASKLLNESKLNEARLECLLRITRFETHNVQELLDYALKEAIALSDSRIGYIYFYSEERREFTLNTWSDKVMEACAVAEKQTVYQLDKTGIWGEAVRQRKPIIVNEFKADNPLKKGYPEGHVELLRFLTVPVIIENHIVAVVGVANRETDYTDSDVRQLTLMMETVWHISEKVRAEAELKEAQAIIRAAMDCSQAGIAIADAPSGRLRYVNKAGMLISGKPESEIVENVDAEKYVSRWSLKNHDGSPLEPDEVPLARAVLLGESSSREFVVERSDGEHRTVIANAEPIMDESGKKIRAAVVVFLDITDLRVTRKILDEQNKELKLKIEELARFNKLMIGREKRMIEMKKEVNELCSLLKFPARYLIDNMEEEL